MTISTTESRISYNGNGVTTAFATTFRFFESADLVVSLVETDGTVVVQTITTDYTVTGADVDAGGTVTMVVPPASGERLVIQRVIGATQETDYASGDSFPAESHERALDKLTMLVQQNTNDIGLALRLDPTSIGNAELPAPEAGKFLGWSGDGLSIVNLASTGTGAGEIGTVNLADGAVTTVKIADDAVTFDKVQNIATARFLGRTTAGSGAIEELTATDFFTAIKQAASETATGVVELATTAEAQAGTDTSRAITPAGLAAAGFTQQLANVTLVSQTEVDFTIPTGVKEICVHFSKVSKSGTDNIIVQLGSSGVPETSGYVSASVRVSSAAGGPVSSTAGFIIECNAASFETSGHMQIKRTGTGDLWTESHHVMHNTAQCGVGGGDKAVSAVPTLVRVRPTGTNTFDAGVIGLSYRF